MRKRRGVSWASPQYLAESGLRVAYLLGNVTLAAERAKAEKDECYEENATV